MPDPFKWLSESSHRPALLLFFLLSAALLTSMHALDQTLITEAAPSGIVSFELAGSIEKVAQILKEWGPQGKAYATLSLGLDYLFLFVYALFISCKFQFCLVGGGLDSAEALAPELTTDALFAGRPQYWEKIR